VPWFRVDDNLAFHHKAIAAGNAAMGLWVRSGSWSMQQLTDGFIPAQVARSIGTPNEAKRLCSAGLWVPQEDGGYSFHEWVGRQPSAEDVKRVAESKGTAGARGNHLRWHKRRGVKDPDCEWCLGVAE
jgi:hypothetical protein